MSKHGGITDQLDDFLPRFDLNGSQIEVIDTPSDFYANLIRMIQGADRRIFLSSMYISKDAFELRDALRNSLVAKPGLKVSVLMDALRGTRSDHLRHQNGGEFFALPQNTKNETPSSMLVPLLQEFGPDRIEVSLYHTPNLRGIWKRIIPRWLDEGFGLQHTKIYGADEQVIVSGANLSHEYFTNRQDRYYLFSSKDVSDYMEKVHEAIKGFSFSLVADISAERGYSLRWPESNFWLNTLKHPKDLKEKVKEALGTIIRRQVSEKSYPAFSDHVRDTVMYPLAQLAPLLGHGASTEDNAIRIVVSALCSKLLKGACWTLSTPYFNPASFLRTALLSTTARRGLIVTGAPQATSFYGTKGLTGYIPSAFTPEARKFLTAAENKQHERQVQLWEWQRGFGDRPEGWTFHAKGLWVVEDGEDDPFMTIVGSCNYGERSLTLDLEQDTLIITRNEDLKRRIGDEERRIRSHAAKVTRQGLSTGARKTGLVVYILLWFIRLLGASI